MSDRLIAPSMPKNISKEDITDIEIPKFSEKKQKKSIFQFSKKENPLKEKQTKMQEIDIPKNTIIDKLKKVENEEEHVLNQVNRIEKDIQIPEQVRIKKDKKIPELNTARHSTLDSIEEVYFNNDSKEETINQENVKKLRKALGLEKDKSGKSLKIDEFKRKLFDESDTEQDMVTDLDLEQKLQKDIEISSSEEVKHIKIGITMDTDCTDQNAFVLSDGRRLKSLRDLRNALENMSNSVFNNHVDKEKNDFAEWVKDTFKEPKLANIILRCRKKEILLSLLVTIEKIEIEELIMLKEKDILDKHNETLKDLDFMNKEREEINKEKELIKKEEDSIDDLRNSLEKKIEEIKQKQKNFAQEIEQTKIDKITVEEEKELLEKEEQDFKIDIGKEYELKKQETEKAKKDYLESIKKQNQEFDELRNDLLEETNEYKEKLEQDYENKLRLLNDREMNLKKQKQELDSFYESKMKELKKEQQQLYGLKKQINEKQIKLLQQENEAKQHISKLSETLAESKIKDNEINSKLEINKNILAEIRQRELALKRIEKEIQDGAFQKYLNSELQKLLGPEEFLPKEKQANEIEIAEIYSEIEKCKKLAQSKKIKQARAAYNQIRENFYSAKIPEQEKDILKNILRNLYAEIHMQEI